MKSNQLLENRPAPGISPAFTHLCLRSCQKVLAQIWKVKGAIFAEWRDGLKDHESMLRLALNEAEALAWQTGTRISYSRLSRRRKSTRSLTGTDINESCGKLNCSLPWRLEMRRQWRLGAELTASWFVAGAKPCREASSSGCQPRD